MLDTLFVVVWVASVHSTCSFVQVRNIRVTILLVRNVVSFPIRFLSVVGFINVMIMMTIAASLNNARLELVSFFGLLYGSL